MKGNTKLSPWSGVTRVSIAEAAMLIIGKDPCLEVLTREQAMRAGAIEHDVRAAVSRAARAAWEHARFLDILSLTSNKISNHSLLRTVAVWDFFDDYRSCLATRELRESVAAVSADPENIAILTETRPWYTATVLGQDLNGWLQSNEITSLFSFPDAQRVEVVRVGENWSAREDRRAGGFQHLSEEALALAEEAQEYCVNFYEWFELEDQLGPASSYFGQMIGDESGIDLIAYEMASFDHSEWLQLGKEIDLDAAMPLLRLIWADAASARYLCEQTGNWDDMWTSVNKAVRWMSVLKGIELMSGQEFLNATGSDVKSVADHARALGRVNGLASRIALYAEARKWIWSKWLTHSAEYKNIKSRFARDYCRLIAHEFSFADGSGLTVSIDTITEEWLKGPPPETLVEVETANELVDQPAGHHPRAFWQVV